jgi:hypothetical protein
MQCGDNKLEKEEGNRQLARSNWQHAIGKKQ